MLSFGAVKRGTCLQKTKDNLKASTTVLSGEFSTSNGNKYKMIEFEINK